MSGLFNDMLLTKSLYISLTVRCFYETDFAQLGSLEFMNLLHILNIIWIIWFRLILRSTAIHFYIYRCFFNIFPTHQYGYDSTYVYYLKMEYGWKGYLPNLLETALLCQIFVFWVTDFKLWLLAYIFISFNCAKFQQDWTTLILDIL